MLSITMTGSATEGPTVLTLSGVLDPDGSARLLERVRRLIDGGCRHLVLNLAGVTFCDSSGISALLRARAKAAEAESRVRLSTPSPALKRALALTGMTWVFQDSVDQ